VYSIIPPNVQLVVSAPDAFSNIVFSASSASLSMSSLEYLVNKPEIELAAATQHAEEDPNPTPAGISDLIDMVNPESELNCLRIFCARKIMGLNLISISSIN